MSELDEVLKIPRVDSIHTCGWKDDARRLRKIHEDDAAVMKDFVALFEAAIPANMTEAKKNKELCLAALGLHHLAMRFHSGAGPRAKRLLLCGTATVDELPKSFGNFGRKS